MNVEMYYMDNCPYCRRAMELLDAKRITPILHDVNLDPKLWEEIKTRFNRSTVPQIVIGDYHVGGCDDLMALERDNKLDDYLNGKY